MRKLTAAKVKNLREPGMYADGDGLYLQIKASGGRSWILRVQHNGKRRDIGLGGAVHVGLAEAREKAAAVRKQLRDGIDPVREKRKAQESALTFEEAARLVHAAHEPVWRNPTHRKQWITSLEQYAFPRLGKLDVDEITAPMVREVLVGIWLEVPETARRVKQRIGAVLDWSFAEGHRETETPMRAIALGLPKQPKGQRHHPAMPWRNIAGFLEELRVTQHAGDVVRLAIEFLILTAARSGEVRGALWSEIDWDEKTWTVPGARMKAGREHIVPLSEGALSVLRQAKDLRRRHNQRFIFEGAKAGKPLSDMALSIVMRRMKTGVVPHGFRSSFKDWALDTTDAPREVVEAALAHTVRDKVERAYARTNHLDRRRALMTMWADHCAGGRGEIVPMNRYRV